MSLFIYKIANFKLIKTEDFYGTKQTVKLK